MDLTQLTDEVEAVSSHYASKHGIERDTTWFLSQVLLMARHHGVDLQAEVERKWLVWKPDEVGGPHTGQ